MSGSSGVESDDDKEIVEHSNSNKRHEKQHKSRKEKGTRKNSNGHDSNQTTEGDSPPHKKVRTDNDNDHSTNDAPGKTEKADNLMTKTGGAYIPPARLRLMQKDITDKSSETYQRISWEALKKSINGLVNKVNTSNIKEIVLELLQENIVRGRGLLARSILAAQNASPTFTNVYAALVAIINSRFPQNGELILRRVVAQFRRSFKRNIKDMCLHSCQFIAHLINQQVAHEILGLQILTLLLETPTDDSVEVGIGFLKECGQKLTEVSPRGLAAVFEQLRLILNEQQLEKRVQYMIEVMFAIRKDGFKEHPPVIEELDQVDENDQFTHMLTVDDDNIAGLENQLNVFRLDPDFQNTEDSYKKIKAEILDESDRSGSEGSTSESSDDDQAEDDEEAEEPMEITDKTETNLVALRRTIYLAIQSSLSFEECAHKIMKMEFTENDYPEICAMIIDCCSQQRTYEKFFGLLAGRFACLKQKFMEQFEIQFAQQYETIHRLETSKLRNVAKFFAHLLHSDSLPWSVLSNIVLSEDTTTSSARIFIKILLLEVTEYMGVSKFNERLKDPTLAPFFEGLFPRNNPKATRFAINFFTTIGLGSLTEDLREHLKQSAKQMQQKMQAEQLAALAAAASSSSSDESASSASPDESSDGHKKKKKKKNKKSSKKKKKKAKKLKRKKSKKSRREATPSPARTSSDESEQNTVTHAPVSAKPEKEDLRTRLMRLANMVPGASGDAPPAPTPVAPVVTASANENDSFVERMKAKCLKNRNKGNKSPEVASFEHRSNSPSESDGSDVRKALIRERSVSREKSTEPRSMEQRNVVRQRSDSPQSTNGQDQSHLTRSPQAQMNHGRSQRSRSDSRRPGRSRRGSRSDSRRRPRSPHRSRSHSRRNGTSRRDRRSRSDSRRDRTSRRERRSRSDSRRNRTSRRERRSRSDSRRNRSSRRGRRSRSDSRRDRTSRRDRRSRSDSRRDRISRRDRRSRSDSRRDRTSRRERRSHSNSRRNRTSRRDRRSRSNSRRNQTSRRIRRSHSSPRRDTIARRDRSHSSEIPKSYQINIRRSRSHSRGVQNYRSSRKYARNQSSSTDSEEEQASSPGYVKSDGNSDNSDVHSSSDDSGVVSKRSLKPHNSARGKDSKNAPKTVERGATVSKTLQDTQNDLVIKKNSTGDSHTHQATSSGDAGRAGRSQVKTKGGKSDTNSARDGNTSSGYRKDHKSLNKGSDSDDSQNESDHDDLQIHNNKRDGDRDSSCDSQMSVGDESSPKEELSIDARIGGREVENESRSNPPDDNSVGDGNSPTCSPADYRSPNRRSESNGWESDAGDLKRDQSDRDRDSSCDSRMSVDGQNSPEELCEDVRTGNLRGDVIESEKRPSVDRHSEAEADYATKSRSQSRSTSGESSPDGKVATNNQRQKNVDRSESSSSSVQSPKANTDNWSDSAENKDSVIPAKSPRTPDDHPYSLAQNNSAKETITREGSYHASDVSDESDTKHRRLTAGKNNGELISPRTSEKHRRKRRTTRSASPTSSEESPGHAEEDDHRKKSSVKRSDSKDRFDRSAEREKKKKEQRKPRRRSPSVEKSLPNKAHQIIRRMSDDDGDNSSSSDDSTTRQAKGTRRDRSRHMIHREHSDEETARYRKKLSSRDREHDSKGRKGSSRSRHRKGKRSSEKRGSTPEKSMSPVRRRHERKRSRDRQDRRSSRRSSRRRDRKSSRRARRSESEDSRSNSSAASDDDRRRRRVHTGRSRHHY